MKSWTLSLAALALLVGLPLTMAQQGAPKSQERQKLDRKIDAAAATPFVTKHQAAVLKGDLDKGEAMKEDEKTAYPQVADGTKPDANGMVGNAGPGQAPPEEKQAEPEKKEEPKAPVYRLMGTVCGQGKNLAMFATGAEWPKMLKAGEMLDDSTKVVKVERGHVVLEYVEVTYTQAPQPQGPPAEGQPTQHAQPVKHEAKRNFDLYAW